MATNEFKKEEIQEQEPVKKKKKVSKGTKSGPGAILRSILNGEIFTHKAVVKFLPFGLFLCFLATLYIANSYNYEKNIRKTEEIRNQLIELEYEFITVKSDLMHISQQTEIAHRLDSMGTGIKEPVVPPFKIVDQNNLKKETKNE